MDDRVELKLEPRVPSLEDYRPIVGSSELRTLQTLAGSLAGRTVKMVNSTAVGGGVAEILNRVIPLLSELGVPTRWEVIKGGEEFFEVTKDFHNALHGQPLTVGPEEYDIYLTATEMNRRNLTFDEDFVVIHDPQPAGLVLTRAGRHNHWIWRCHIDLSNPHPEVWSFLHQFVCRYDVALFSSPSFTRRLEIPQYLFYPSIDPLSEKNRELDASVVRATLERYGIDPGRPVITQVSRFDRLKDPVGVIQAYRLVKAFHPDCQLVLAGGSASDDPEGEAVWREVQEAAGSDPDIHVLNLPPWSHLEINALQRGSTVIVQKSLREGFGLTVTEALWKKKPVVASAVGGIPLQVIHKLTGQLAHSVEGTAYQVRLLLSNPAMANRLGELGQEHVREHFLITSNLKRYLTLFLRMLRPS